MPARQLYGIIAGMCKPIAKPYHVEIRAGYRPIIHSAVRQAAKIPVNRDYDVPYLAGASNDDSEVFIDRHLPASFEYRGRQIEVDKYLRIHECVEKALMEKLGLPYKLAHKIATDEEYRALLVDGVPLKPYTDFMNEHVKEAGSEDITVPPPDGELYLKPYMQEHDQEHLSELSRTS